MQSTAQSELERQQRHLERQFVLKLNSLVAQQISANDTNWADLISRDLSTASDSSPIFTDMVAALNAPSYRERAATNSTAFSISQSLASNLISIDNRLQKRREERIFHEFSTAILSADNRLFRSDDAPLNERCHQLVNLESQLSQVAKLDLVLPNPDSQPSLNVSPSAMNAMATNIANLDAFSKKYLRSQNKASDMADISSSASTLSSSAQSLLEFSLKDLERMVYYNSYHPNNPAPEAGVDEYILPNFERNLLYLSEAEIQAFVNKIKSKIDLSESMDSYTVSETTSHDFNSYDHHEYHHDVEESVTLDI